MSEKSESNFSRAFKGIWIPKEVWLDKRLTYFEKCLLAEIHSLDDPERGCYCKNQYFIEFFNEKERTIQCGLSKLKNLGYIRYENFDGRTRTLRSNLYPDKSLFNTPEVQNSAPQGCKILHPSSLESSIETDNIIDNICKKNPPNPPEGGKHPSGAATKVALECFGSHIKLKKEDYENFCDEYGKTNIDGLFEEINDWISSGRGKAYKDFAAGIRTWIRRRGWSKIEKNNVEFIQPKEQPKKIKTNSEVNQQWLLKFMLEDEFKKKLVRDWRMRQMENFVEFIDLPEGKIFFDQEPPVFQVCIQSAIRKLQF